MKCPKCGINMKIYNDYVLPEGEFIIGECKKCEIDVNVCLVERGFGSK